MVLNAIFPTYKNADVIEIIFYLQQNDERIYLYKSLTSLTIVHRKLWKIIFTVISPLVQ